jgi:hypothetical protein
MYKKILVFVLLTVALVLFASCEQKIGEKSYDDLIGTWVFPPYEADSPFILVNEDAGNQTLDITWYVGTDRYYCHVEGTYSQCEFTGTYTYLITDGDTNPSGNNQAITISFTFSSDELKIVCAGDGPLDGITFEEGDQTT